MKVSEWLRRYQITGAIPEDKDNPMVAFWAGWLAGHSGQIDLATTEERIKMAIKAAEFIEGAK
jgi:hypothetical protein